MSNIDLSTDWYDIPGFTGLYQISKSGLVMSVPRVVLRNGLPLTIPGKLLKAAPHKGYARVSLRRDGRTHYRFVHQLMAETFLGPQQKGFDVRHLDGDSSNNRIENLAYGSRSENVADAIRTRGLKTGEDSPNARLSASDIAYICESSETALVLAERFGVKPGYIAFIRRGRARTYDNVIRKDSYRPKGHDVAGSKLTEEDVYFILSSTESARALARRFDVDKASILNIRHGKTWKHIPRS